MQKVILITGGSEGLGRALAKQLSPNHNVIILSRTEENLKKVSENVKCEYKVCDVTNWNQVENAVGEILSSHGKIDVLINNAGIYQRGALENVDSETIRQVIAVNVVGLLYMIKAVLPSMKRANSGTIINIGSTTGIRPKHDRAVYGGSKWAVTGITRCLDVDMQDTEIRIFGVYPGKIKTNLYKNAGYDISIEKALNPDEIAEKIEEMINSPETVEKELIIEP